jgi:hypothetical protein
LSAPPPCARRPFASGPRRGAPLRRGATWAKALVNAALDFSGSAVIGGSPDRRWRLAARSMPRCVGFGSATPPRRSRRGGLPGSAVVKAAPRREPMPYCRSCTGFAYLHLAPGNCIAIAQVLPGAGLGRGCRRKRSAVLGTGRKNPSAERRRCLARPAGGAALGEEQLLCRVKSNARPAGRFLERWTLAGVATSVNAGRLRGAAFDERGPRPAGTCGPWRRSRRTTSPLTTE